MFLLITSLFKILLSNLKDLILNMMGLKKLRDDPEQYQVSRTLIDRNSKFSYH